MDRLEAARTRARAERLSLREWGTKYVPHYFPLPASRFHLWLADELHAIRSRRGTLLNVLAPRGAAKSTWASLAYPLQCAVEGAEPYIVLTSDTTGQAEGYLRSLADELEGNEALARDYPGACGKGPAWRVGQLRLRNGVVIEALGAGAKIRGRKNRQHRPSLIIVDDPQNKNHIISALQRERSWEWLTKDVCNAGDPQTNTVVLGTALHREAIVYRLQTTPGWRSKVWQALEALPERMDLWAKWEAILNNYGLPDAEREAKARAFYEANRPAMDKGTEGKVLWPERESLYHLMLLRATVGVSAFASEKLNDPTDPSACEWPAAYFPESIWFSEWPSQFVCRALALDPAQGKGEKGCYAAFVFAGLDPRGVVWVDAWMSREWDAVQLVDKMFELHRQLRPDAVSVETNGAQEFLPPLFLARAKELNTFLPLHGTNNTVDKEQRIRVLGPFLAQGRLRFHSTPGSRLLVQQLRDFPTADDKDGPDALEMSLRLLLHQLGQWKGQGQPQIVGAR